MAKRQGATLGDHIQNGGIVVKWFGIVIGVVVLGFLALQVVIIGGYKLLLLLTG